MNELNVEKIKLLCEKLHILPTNGHDEWSLLNINGKYSTNTNSPFENKDFLIEILVSCHLSIESKKESIMKLGLYPTELTLYNDSELPNEFYNNNNNSFSNGNTLVLSLPKLNLQFLTVYDYLLRNFLLYRLESAHSIRQDIAKCVWKLRPRLKRNHKMNIKETIFTGYSRMGVSMNEFSLMNVKRPKLGETVPSSVTAEIEIDLKPFTGNILKEWNELREHDVLFLVKIHATQDIELLDNINDKFDDIMLNKGKNLDGITGVGKGKHHKTWDNLTQNDLGVEFIRGCCIKYIKDSRKDDAPIIGSRDWETNEIYTASGTKRFIMVELDSAQYANDMANMSLSNNNNNNSNGNDLLNVYSSSADNGFNLLIRRKSKENNFKAVLQTIRELLSTNAESAYLNEHERMNMTSIGMKSDIIGDNWCLPDWLHNVFLGYEDPTAATYYKLGALSVENEKNDEIVSVATSMIPDISEQMVINESYFEEMIEQETNTSNTNDLTTSKKYKNLIQKGYYCLDFKDTFISAKHILNSFPSFEVKILNEKDNNKDPPYRIWFPKSFLTQMSDDIEFRDEYIQDLLKYSLLMGVEDSDSETTDEDTIISRKKKHILYIESYHDVNSLSVLNNDSYSVSEDISSLDAKILGNHILSLHLSGDYATYVNSLHIKQNTIEFTPIQIEAIKSGLHYGLSLIVGPPGTGKTDVAVQIINNLYNNFENERILMITHSNHALNDLFEKIMLRDIDEKYLLRLGYGASDIDTKKFDTSNKLNLKHDFSKFGRINYMLNLRIEYLSDAQLLAQTINHSEDRCATCETAILFFNYQILQLWEDFEEFLYNFEMKYSHIIGNIDKYYNEKIIIKKDKQDKNDKNDKNEEEQGLSCSEYLAQQFPFTKFIQRSIESKYDSIFGEWDENKIDLNISSKFSGTSDEINIFETNKGGYAKDKQYCYKYWYYIESIFNELKSCHVFELLRTFKDRCQYLLTKQSKIIAMTCTHAAMNRNEFIRLSLNYDTIIIEEAAQILDIETFIPIVLQSQSSSNNINKNRLKRVILIGDHYQLPPIIKNFNLIKFCRFDQSLFTRLIRIGVPYYLLNMQGRARPSIAKLYSWRYESLGNLDKTKNNIMYSLANTGFSHEYQLINVENYLGIGEHQPNPYFYQNLGEAEYIVQVYMFMRLLGYPNHSITVLTTYNGQKHLIREIMNRKCLNDPMFGMCNEITTVDKYQGSQNQYILLSLVRTNNVGYIRDIKRLVVTMSRSQLGLYIFARFKLFSNCFELGNVFKLLLDKESSLKLKLVTNETYPTQRRVSIINQDSKHFYVDNVQHMAFIVEKMANAVRVHLSKQYNIKLKRYMKLAESALNEKKLFEENERKEKLRIENELKEKELEREKQLLGNKPMLPNITNTIDDINDVNDLNETEISEESGYENENESESDNESSNESSNESGKNIMLEMEKDLSKQAASAVEQISEEQANTIALIDETDEIDSSNESVDQESSSSEVESSSSGED